MSQLNLSIQLVDQMHEFLIQHDENAQDPGVAAQYLCAIVGCLLGKQEMPESQKEGILEQLMAFTRHVVKDVAQQVNAPPSQAEVGIWKPGMS
jgi:5,10-methenyltetrahydromethanopterin hydrogenase